MRTPRVDLQALKLFFRLLVMALYLRVCCFPKKLLVKINPSFLFYFVHSLFKLLIWGPSEISVIGFIHHWCKNLYFYLAIFSLLIAFDFSWNLAFICSGVNIFLELIKRLWIFWNPGLKDIQAGYNYLNCLLSTISKTKKNKETRDAWYILLVFLIPVIACEN